MIARVIEAYRIAYSDVPKPIWLLSGAIFVNRLGTMVLPFLTLYLTKSINYSDSTAGFMISLYGVGSVIGAYLGGRLTRSVGAIRLQIILLLLSVPVFLVLPFCGKIFPLSLAILSLSIFSEGIRPANQTAITEHSSPEQRTRSFALNRMALNLGISFGPVIGGLLITIDFFWIFVADALTTAGCAILLWRFFSVSDDKRQHAIERQKKASGASSELSPAKDVNFLIYLALTFFCAIVFFQFFTTFPLYLNEHYGLSELQIGLIFSVNTVMIVVLEMLLVERAKNWNLMLTIAWGSLLTCLGFGVLPLSNAVWFCVFAMVVLTLGEMLQSPMSASWVSQRSENRDVGSYMGWYTISYSLAFIVGPAVGGVIYEIQKDLVFYLSLFVGALGFMGFIWLNSRLVAEKSAVQSSSE